ncbi:ABC transporter permease subunit [Mesorhizobium sp. WSM4307]|jgi:amine acid ABC transporter, permease protein, 3-TM region, His/Glu/Gln/Arg/opine family|uniref:ABC transporter permease n=1 Tax=unclassified Mesorhizobium TaxID=325217 RepID=UPI000BAF5E7D|nr:MULTISPECIES: ABC transporter permease subunit [unclassified Mesorhizobium]PBB24481.1 ABC transporter permease [Mesorhizobium sp. WSM4304]PBB74550.1 ABC transporter permease [Mesorhizobium sp. WSM4308]TRC73284.1 ABC transporter permease subunit [Mesorhizobium sp. WSM4315]TRC83563.1 ABC transporter permease subunit [Mesorhizobium sp. WSM4307]
MNDFGLTTVFSFAPGGWGSAMSAASAMTIAVAVTGFIAGAIIGGFGAWAKISGGTVLRALADGYTTVLRGIPDLLVIYLFYFGSSAILTPIGRVFGAQGFLSLPAFLAGALAIAIVSGAYHTEVFRGAYQVVARGEIEAAYATGMSTALAFRRIIAPLTLRFAVPGLANIWQLVLKESSLISVTGLVEILRQAQVGAGSTKQPFTFFLAAAILYLLISSASGWALQYAEKHFTRGLRRG